MVLTDVKSINKPFDVMTYLFVFTKHIKYGDFHEVHSLK